MSDDHYFLSVIGKKSSIVRERNINYVDFLRKSVKVWARKMQKKKKKFKVEMRWG